MSTVYVCALKLWCWVWCLTEQHWACSVWNTKCLHVSQCAVLLVVMMEHYSCLCALMNVSENNWHKCSLPHVQWHSLDFHEDATLCGNKLFYCFMWTVVNRLSSERHTNKLLRFCPHCPHLSKFAWSVKQTRCVLWTEQCDRLFKYYIACQQQVIC